MNVCQGAKMKTFLNQKLARRIFACETLRVHYCWFTGNYFNSIINNARIYILPASSHTQTDTHSAFSNASHDAYSDEQLLLQ